MAESKRRKDEVLVQQLLQERASHLPLWRDLGEQYFPRRPRFTVSDTNKGDRRNQKIINATPTMAARTLRSGMMAGVTSPARPWFRLTTPDPNLAESGPVKEWLHTVSMRMSGVFLKSNLYNILPIIYGDTGVFATAAMWQEEDFDAITRFYSFPIGSYAIATNDKLKVDVLTRDFRMTVRQLVQKFGKKDERTGKPDWSVFSTHVKSMWDRSEYETWIDVRHLVQPNMEFDPKKLNSKYKKFSSCYFESASGGGYNDDDRNKYLSEKGYDFFPGLVPRWETTGEDAWGTECPGIIALGDCKQLQLGEKRSAQAIEKMVNPPMTGPTSMKNSKATILPGDITYLDTRDGQQGFRPAHEVSLRIAELESKNESISKRIQRAFYEDLFLMLANSDRRDITAREIDERHEEKLLALGPVLEQFNQDCLDPLIDNTYDMMLRKSIGPNGKFIDGAIIPEPPQELRGIDLKVEYISVMAQAQKLVGIGGQERFTQYLGQVASFDPSVLAKFNSDQAIDVYGDMCSVNPSIIRTDEDAQALRDQQAEAAQNQAKGDIMNQSANTAKTLSETDTEGDNALTGLLKQMGSGG